MFQMLHNDPAIKYAHERDYLLEIVNTIAIPRPYGSENHQFVKNYIKQELGSQALEIHGNILVGEPSTATILVGAHYDSCPDTPGADDNASAVAVMLLARRLVQQAGKFDSNILFVAFDREEVHKIDGVTHEGIAGSYEFVQWLVKEYPKNKLKEAHILEMVGYTSYNQVNPLPGLLKDFPERGDFLGLLADKDCKKTIENILKITTTLPITALLLEQGAKKGIDLWALPDDILRSDHLSFWEASIPAIMWTDTANFRNPNYHKITDRADTLDYTFMEETARVLTTHLVRNAKAK